MTRIIETKVFDSLSSTAKRQYVLGAITDVIESFKHNPDVRQFLKNTLAIEYKDYVFKSKTLVIARTVRDINSRIIDDRSYAIKVLNLLQSFTSEASNAPLFKNFKADEEAPTTKKKNNSNDKLNKWLKGLS
ncbi:hypothetical protein [Lacticaseibacillus mingshuiensis]|uniref:hypothetical protein n=1 Tax=Lacticaseibacillus mingshuiensis TaxID=2799574 RepID=UPI00195279E2|nr:hypothetical protein [Lacticaseibacillus mingshuiensis]